MRIKTVQLLGVQFEVLGKFRTPVLQQGKQFLAAEDSAHDARGRLQPVAGERVHLYRPQQADLVVVPEHAHGHPANGCEFSDVEHDRCHDSRAYCVRLNAIPNTWPGIASFRSAPGGLAAPGNEMYRAARQIPKAPRQRSPG